MSLSSAFRRDNGLVPGIIDGNDIRIWGIQDSIVIPPESDADRRWKAALPWDKRDTVQQINDAIKGHAHHRLFMLLNDKKANKIVERIDFHKTASDTRNVTAAYLLLQHNVKTKPQGFFDEDAGMMAIRKMKYAAQQPDNEAIVRLYAGTAAVRMGRLRIGDEPLSREQRQADADSIRHKSLPSIVGATERALRAAANAGRDENLGIIVGHALHFEKELHKSRKNQSDSALQSHIAKRLEALLTWSMDHSSGPHRDLLDPVDSNHFLTREARKPVIRMLKWAEQETKDASISPFLEDYAFKQKAEQQRISDLTERRREGWAIFDPAAEGDKSRILGVFAGGARRAVQHTTRISDDEDMTRVIDFDAKKVLVLHREGDKFLIETPKPLADFHDSFVARGHSFLEQCKR